MLGLKTPTDPAWAAVALADLDAVLVDHAHCEMKAASNAMSLATRHPRNTAMVLRLAEIAREEIDHFARVVEKLAERQVPLGPPPVDAYAAELRRRTAALPGIPHEGTRDLLVERLLVASLIEARSAERFSLLVAAMGPEHELYAFYTELLASEARHHRVFVDLAIEVAGGDAARVRARLERMAEVEGEIVRGSGPPRPVIHG
jgi:tRNA-(ms[2]io[6]A)-hydroxylase